MQNVIHATLLSQIDTDWLIHNRKKIISFLSSFFSTWLLIGIPKSSFLLEKMHEFWKNDDDRADDAMISRWEWRLLLCDLFTKCITAPVLIKLVGDTMKNDCDYCEFLVLVILCIYLLLIYLWFLRKNNKKNDMVEKQ